MRDEESYIEGRNPVTEALRSGKTIERLFVLDNCYDGPIRSIVRDGKKLGIRIDFVPKSRLDEMSVQRGHQGVIAYIAAHEYASVEDIMARAAEKGEPPFIIFLDQIEDPHNLGAIIRTANVVGAHGVVIPKNRAAGITATVAKASAGAVNYTPVARVANLSQTIENLKKEGMWFVCADMGGDEMYNVDMTGSIGLVIGNEGSGVSPSVRKHCDLVAAIPMKGDIDSLNASVSCGILCYEALRQRRGK